MTTSARCVAGPYQGIHQGHGHRDGPPGPAVSIDGDPHLGRSAWLRPCGMSSALRGEPCGMLPRRPCTQSEE
jgi:hypothetical protein